MGAPFHSVKDFNGIYHGSYDGRSAKLQIDTFSPSDSQRILYFTFTDLDRNVTVTGKKQTNIYDNTYHVTDIELGPPNEEPTIFWPDLFLHTWDTDYISGVSNY